MEGSRSELVGIHSSTALREEVMINQFVSVTGCGNSTARELLTLHSWHWEVNYYVNYCFSRSQYAVEFLCVWTCKFFENFHLFLQVSDVVASMLCICGCTFDILVLIIQFYQPHFPYKSPIYTHNALLS